MGSQKSKLTKKNVLMIGLDSVGKSTILKKLGVGKLLEIIPSIGVRYASLEIEKYNITITSTYICWHEESQKKLRYLPFCKVDVLVFVIDAHDKARVDELLREERRTSSSKELLHHLVSKETEIITADIPILFIANKVDFEDCIATQTLMDRLDISKVVVDRKWSFIATSAVTGEGIEAILPWILNSLQR